MKYLTEPRVRPSSKPSTLTSKAVSTLLSGSVTPPAVFSAPIKSRGLENLTPKQPNCSLECSWYCFLLLYGRRRCLLVPCLPIVISIAMPHMRDRMWQAFYLWCQRDGFFALGWTTKSRLLEPKMRRIVWFQSCMILWRLYACIYSKRCAHTINWGWTRR